MKIFFKFLFQMILSLVVVFAIAGNAQKPVIPDPIVPDEPIVGSWQNTSEFPEVVIPEAAQEVFDKAIADIDGARYDVIAYLGSRMVSGIEYAYLCNITSVIPQATNKIKVVTVYAAFNGTTKIKSIEEVQISDYTQDASIDFGGNLGGYYYGGAVGCGLDVNCQAAFDNATEGLSGIGFTPLACIATQVVAGTNYAILCKATRVAAQSQYSLAVVVVYEALDGTASILSTCGFAV